jgi:MFS superfamily sulfate permease-like transporter
VNDASGARSQLAGLVTTAATALTLLALAPLFSDLPLAVLAGIVLVASLDSRIRRAYEPFAVCDSMSTGWR